ILGGQLLAGGDTGLEDVDFGLGLRGEGIELGGGCGKRFRQCEFHCSLLSGMTNRTIPVGRSPARSQIRNSLARTVNTGRATAVNAETNFVPLRTKQAGQR